MGTARSARIADQIQRSLAELIRTEVRDPRVGLVTLTGVELSRDQSHAKVFYTVMGSQNQNARSMVMDGEVALVTAAWPSIIPYIDLMSLIGQSEWLDDPARLKDLLPPQSKFRTRMSHWFRYFF